MAASSAYASAPVTVIAAVMTHTRRSAPGPQDETCREMSAETIKIPEPIIDPTTSDMAASGPIPRMNSEGAEVLDIAFAGAAIQYSDVAELSQGEIVRTSGAGVSGSDGSCRFEASSAAF